MSSDDTGIVTLGEVHRLVQVTRHEHGIKLEAIIQQTTLTNGRVTAHEVRVTLLERIVFGVVTLALIAVATALLSIVVKGPAR